MANDLFSLLGANSQTGLGPIATAANNQQASDMQQQQGLAQLMKSQQDLSKGALDLQESQALLPSKIQAGISTNQATTGANAIKNQEQFGQLASQLGDAFNQVPPEQRQQALQAIGQKIPGIMDQPVFQQFLTMNPNEMPAALKSFGTNMLLQSQDQLKAVQLRKMQDDAAMDRTRLTESGAYGRAGMGENAAMARLLQTQAGNKELEEMRIGAGKYQKRQQGVSTIMDIAGKAGYEKAATAALLLSKDRDSSESDRQYYASLAEELAQANERQRSASATGRPTIDPTAPGGIGMVLPGGQQGTPVFGGQPQQQAAPGRTVTRTGKTKDGRRVVQYSDGSVEYAQ